MSGFFFENCLVSYQKESSVRFHCCYGLRSHEDLIVFSACLSFDIAVTVATLN